MRNCHSNSQSKSVNVSWLLHISILYNCKWHNFSLPFGIPHGALVRTLSKKSKSYSRAGGKVRPTWHVTFVTFNNSSVTMRPLMICNTGFILSIVYISLVRLPFVVFFNLPWRWHNLELYYIFLISGWLPQHNSLHLHQFGAIGVPVKVMRSMSHPTRQRGRWGYTIKQVGNHYMIWIRANMYKWNPSTKLLYSVNLNKATWMLLDKFQYKSRKLIRFKNVDFNTKL